MYSKIATSFFSSLQNKRITTKKYYSSKEINIATHISYPYCMDCRFYIPMEHSPLFPNSACKYSPHIKPCTTMRSKSELCGKEGKYYFPRINSCEYAKNRIS
jgi:hypothetical protein